MSTQSSRRDFTAHDVRRHAERTGRQTRSERHPAVAATVNHIISVIGTLRTIDLGDTPPTTDPVRGESMR